MGLTRSPVSKSVCTFITLHFLAARLYKGIFLKRLRIGYAVENAWEQRHRVFFGTVDLAGNSVRRVFR